MKKIASIFLACLVILVFVSAAFSAVTLLNKAGVNPSHWSGLSTNTKPTTGSVGSTFYEEDTGVPYVYGSSGWVQDKRRAQGTATNMASAIHTATNKVTPVGSDEIGIWDSVTQTINRLSLTNLLTYINGSASFIPYSYLDTDGTMAANSDSKVPSQKAVVSKIGATAAPIGGHFITTQAESGLSAEVNLGSLTTGILKHTVAGGVSTPATATPGTDYAPGGIVYTVGVDTGCSTFAAAVATLNAAGTDSTLVIPKTINETLSANLTVNSNIHVVPMFGANLNINSALYTLTFNGPFNTAGRYRCFTISGADLTKGVKFGSLVGKLYPEWWGTGAVAFSQALASSFGHVLSLLPHATYHLQPTANIAITLTDNIELEGNNSTIYWDGDYFLTIQGGAVSTPTLASDITYGNTTISVTDATGIAAGDILYIQSNTAVESNWNSIKRSIHKIQEVSTNDLIVPEPTRWSYTTDEAGLSLIVKRPYKFVSNGVNYRTNSTSSYRIILSYLSPVIINQVLITVDNTINGAGIELERSIGVYITDIETIGYEPILPSTCRNVFITNIWARNGHHPVDAQYWSDGVFIKNAYGYEVAYNNHPSFNVNYDTVEVYGQGFTIRAVGGSAKNVKVYVAGALADYNVHITSNLLNAAGLAASADKGKFVVENFEFITPDHDGTNPSLNLFQNGAKFASIKNITADRINVNPTDNGIDTDFVLKYTTLALVNNAIIGRLIKGTAAEDLVQHQICYNYNGWRVASNVNNLVNVNYGELALATANIANGASGYLMVSGKARNDSWTIAGVGATVFLSTAGGVTVTRPTVTNSAEIEIGVTVAGGDVIEFKDRPLIVKGWRTEAYSASITPQNVYAKTLVINPTNGTAFAINAPAYQSVGEELTFVIYNNYNGTHGDITWNAVFKMAGALGKPAYTKQRSITFWWNGTNWIEKCRVDVDM